MSCGRRRRAIRRYRRVAQAMHAAIAERAGHRAIAAAMRYVDHETYELERLSAERAAEARRSGARREENFFDALTWTDARHCWSGRRAEVASRLTVAPHLRPNTRRPSSRPGRAGNFGSTGTGSDALAAVREAWVSRGARAAVQEIQVENVAITRPPSAGRATQRPQRSPGAVRPFVACPLEGRCPAGTWRRSSAPRLGRRTIRAPLVLASGADRRCAGHRSAPSLCLYSAASRPPLGTRRPLSTFWGQ